MAESIETQRTQEVSVSSEMVDAGLARLFELSEAGVAQSYLVSEVYRAMRELEVQPQPLSDLR